MHLSKIRQDLSRTTFCTGLRNSHCAGTSAGVGILTDANARLGAAVDRYSFIVVDLHRRAA
jgi:hypothetical protein